MQIGAKIRKDKDGNEICHDIFHPVSSLARKHLENAQFAAHKEEIHNIAE